MWEGIAAIGSAAYGFISGRKAEKKAERAQEIGAKQRKQEAERLYDIERKRMEPYEQQGRKALKHLQTSIKDSRLSDTALESMPLYRMQRDMAFETDEEVPAYVKENLLEEIKAKAEIDRKDRLFGMAKMGAGASATLGDLLVGKSGTLANIASQRQSYMAQAQERKKGMYQDEALRTVEELSGYWADREARLSQEKKRMEAQQKRWASDEDAWDSYMLRSNRLTR